MLRPIFFALFALLFFAGNVISSQRGKGSPPATVIRPRCQPVTSNPLPTPLRPSIIIPPWIAKTTKTNFEFYNPKDIQGYSEMAFHVQVVDKLFRYSKPYRYIRLGIHARGFSAKKTGHYYFELQEGTTTTRRFYISNLGECDVQIDLKYGETLPPITSARLVEYR